MITWEGWAATILLIALLLFAIFWSGMKLGIHFREFESLYTKKKKDGSPRIEDGE